MIPITDKEKTGNRKRKFLWYGAFTGAVLFVLSLDDPGMRTSFYARLIGLPMFLFCIGTLTINALRKLSKKDGEDF